MGLVQLNVTSSVLKTAIMCNESHLLYSHSMLRIIYFHQCGSWRPQPQCTPVSGPLTPLLQAGTTFLKQISKLKVHLNYSRTKETGKRKERISHTDTSAQVADRCPRLGAKSFRFSAIADVSSNAEFTQPPPLAQHGARLLPCSPLSSCFLFSSIAVLLRHCSAATRQHLFRARGLLGAESGEGRPRRQPPLPRFAVWASVARGSDKT